MTGCSLSPPQRPDPTTVVADYLGAIADGDAEAAAALDSDAQLPADADAETLRTEAVLAGAAEHISEVEVESDTTVDARADDAEARRVSFHFTLDGRRYDSSLAVAWDDAAEEWRLDETLAGTLYVTATASAIAVEAIPFRVAGATVTPTGGAKEPIGYLAYPAVYEVSTDVPDSLLTDAAAGATRRVALTPEADASVDIPVTRLPSTG
jgi:hypothetical protein